MKKLIANIQDLSARSNNYLSYLFRLAKENNMALEFIHTFSSVEKQVRPTAIVGVGLTYTDSLVAKDDRNDREERLKDLIEPFKKDWRFVNYSLGTGDLMQKINNQAKDDMVVACVIQKASQYNWLNELFGTPEIDLGKQTNLPCLYIPFGYSYRKPREMMVFVNEYKPKDIFRLKRFIQEMDISLRLVTNQNVSDDILVKINESFGDINLVDNGVTRINEVNYNINVIEEIVEKSKVDWLCFLNYDKSFFERIYDLNTNKLLLKSELPSIIV